MTDHLPECDHAQCATDCGKHRCICDLLRACEQRARGDMADPLDHLITFAEGAQSTAYAAGRAEALRDAREAVLGVIVMRDTSWDYRVAAVAAIDALTEGE